MLEESEAMLEVISGQLERLDDMASNLASVSESVEKIEESLRLLLEIEVQRAKRDGIDHEKTLQKIVDKQR
jgi:uncharacterized protein YoxC